MLEREMNVFIRPTEHDNKAPLDCELERVSGKKRVSSLSEPRGEKGEILKNFFSHLRSHTL